MLQRSMLPWILLCFLMLGSTISCEIADDKATDDESVDDDTINGVHNNITSSEWTDPASGLTWQKTPASGYVNWQNAMDYCENLNLAERSDWRLPTIWELRTLVRDCYGTETGGPCAVTDACLEMSCQDETCYPCEYGEGPSDGCFGIPELPAGCDYYWSSSHVADASDRAWAVGFSSAFIYKPRVYYSFHARCVR